MGWLSPRNYPRGLKRYGGLLRLVLIGSAEPRIDERAEGVAEQQRELADRQDDVVPRLAAEDVGEYALAAAFAGRGLGELVGRDAPRVARLCAEVVAADVQDDPLDPRAERPPRLELAELLV